MPRHRATGVAQVSGSPRAGATARGRRARGLRNSTVVLLQSEIERLGQVVQELTARVAELEREAEEAKAVQQGEVIELREISKEQAKQEIVQAFESGQPLDQADLADALSLEISLVVEACNELIEEGVVVFYDDDRC